MSRLHTHVQVPLAGRERELDLLMRACDARRTVLVWGPAGVGKTRIVQEIAARRDDVLVAVDLTQAHDLEGAAAALAMALELPLEDEGPDPGATRLLERSAAALSTRGDGAVILDNVEQLADCIDELVSALPERPALVIGSRRELELTRPTERVELRPTGRCGEQVLLAHCDSVSRDALEADPDSMRLIVERLDALALALALSAKHLRVMSPAQLAHRLSRREGSGALMRALESSWALLDDTTQRALATLSLFHGTFDARDATRVLSDTLPGVTDQQAPDLLTRLREHALLYQFTLDDGTMRHDTLLSVRAFASSKLEADEELTARARASFVEHFASRSLEVHRRARTRFMTQVSRALGLEREHLVQAFAMAGALRDRMRLFLGLQLTLRPLMQRAALEAYAERVGALEAPKDDTPEALELWARARIAYAKISGITWNAALARERMQPVFERAEELRGQLRMDTLMLSVELTPIMPHPEERLRLTRELAERAAAEGDTYARGGLMTMAGEVLAWTGEVAESIELLERARELYSATRSHHAEGYATFHLAAAYSRMGPPLTCIDTFARSAELFRDLGDANALGHALRGLGEYANDFGYTDRAEDAIRELDQLGRRFGLEWMMGYACYLRGQVALDALKTATSVLMYRQALAHFERAGNRFGCASALFHESLAHELAGSLDDARARFDELCAGFPEIMSVPLPRAHVACQRASWAARDGDMEAAHASLAKAHEIAQSTDDSHIHGIVPLHESHVALHAYLGELERGKASDVRARFAAFVEALRAHGRSLAGREHGATFEMRLRWAMIDRELPAHMRHRARAEVSDFDAAALLVDPQAKALRAPSELAWLELGRRHNPWRLFDALWTLRSEDPGARVDPQELFERVWVGESIMPDAAQNRLYVTVANLRKDGLRDLIEHDEGGYRLDPAVDVVVVTPDDEGSPR